MCRAGRLYIRIVVFVFVVVVIVFVVGFVVVFVVFVFGKGDIGEDTLLSSPERRAGPGGCTIRTMY